MTEPLLPAFRFRAEAQWASCRFVGADRRTAAARLGMVPFTPHGASRTFPGDGGFAPAITGSTLLWRDLAGRMWRLTDCDDLPLAQQAPGILAGARRIVAMHGALWAIDGHGRVAAFDVGTFARLIDLDLGAEATIDIAGDGHGGLFVMLQGRGRPRIAHFGSAGQLCSMLSIDAVSDAKSFVYLLETACFILLSADSSRSYWIDATSGALVRSVLINTWRGCFTPTAIGSDGCARLFIGGIDGAAVGGSGQVLTIDDDGDLAGIISFKGQPSGIAASLSQVLVTTAAGALAYAPTDTVPLGAAEIEAQLITPALQSSATGSPQWSRVEATASLPPGCSLVVDIGSAPDAATRDAIADQLADPARSQRQRLDDWRTALGASRSFTFHGDQTRSRTIDDDVSDAARTFAVPLHDIADPYLWVALTIVAAPGCALPRLTGIEIHYAGSALIDQLPALYRRGDAKAGRFLHGFTGVLETTTQDLDGRIAELGRMIHPRTASPEWLDFTASWMGLPWHESLSLAQKRAIMVNAAGLIRGHGTRAGLELLLTALMREQPRRFRVTDYTADYGFLQVGGEGCTGSSLPALLTGLARTAAVLGSRTILGAARLPCDGNVDDTNHLVGRVVIEVAVDATERTSWQPWLATLIAAMLPVSVQLGLRWLGRNALSPDNMLADGAQLVEPPLAHLGTDATTGLARLGGLARGETGERLSLNSVLH